MAARSARTERAAVDPALPFKRRARRRLLGAVLVALVVAIGLPFVLDPEPSFQRPEIRVDIPPRDSPLPADTAPAPSSASTPPPGQGSPQLPQQAASTTSSQVRPQSAPTQPGTSPSSPRVAQAQAPQSSPPPRPAAVSPPVALIPPTNRWLVQAGLFTRAENATALVAKIKAMGLPAYTEAVDGGQGVRLRVRVGPFASRGEADQARARLSLNGIDATLVSP